MPVGIVNGRTEMAKPGTRPGFSVGEQRPDSGQPVHSTAFTMSSTTFLASPKTIMVLSM
jgi:hypothetical protein